MAISPQRFEVTLNNVPLSHYGFSIKLHRGSLLLSKLSSSNAGTPGFDTAKNDFYRSLRKPWPGVGGGIVTVIYTVGKYADGDNPGHNISQLCQYCPACVEMICRNGRDLDFFVDQKLNFQLTIFIYEYI